MIRARLMLPLYLYVAACSGAQRATEKAAVVCGAKDIDAVLAILDDKTTNGAQKQLALAANATIVEACIEASKPPAAAGSGSAK